MIQVHTFTAGVFGENTFLAVDGRGRSGFLVDPGVAVTQALQRAERDGVRIEAILLTHAHLDHIEGLAEARRATSAPIYLHPFDRPLFDAGLQQAAAFGVSLEAPPAPDRTLEHDQTLELPGCGILVRHAPGHAPGHVILHAPEDGLAFVGDVIFAGSIGRTDLPGGDFQTLMAAIRREVLTLPDETVLYTGHGPATTVGNERRGNPFVIPHYGGELA